jgi:hypothetical protein
MLFISLYNAPRCEASSNHQNVDHIFLLLPSRPSVSMQPVRESVTVPPRDRWIDPILVHKTSTDVVDMPRRDVSRPADVGISM